MDRIQVLESFRRARITTQFSVTAYPKRLVRYIYIGMADETVELYGGALELNEETAGRAVVDAQAALEEARRQANDLVAAAQAKVERAKDVAEVVEMFTNVGDDIRCIVEGQHAPASERLVLIQKPLNVAAAMIEETIAASLAAVEDEVDPHAPPKVDLKTFVDWIAQPGYLERVLPDAKCIAALSIAGKPTALLVRNGEAAYVVTPRYKLGDVEALFPPPDVQEQLFSHNSVEPGDQRSVAWARLVVAEKRAERKMKVFYRIAFVMEGIVRNTDILSPLPEGFTLTGGFDAESVELRWESRNVLAPRVDDLDAWVAQVSGEVVEGSRVVVGPYDTMIFYDYSPVKPAGYSFIRPPVGVPLQVIKTSNGRLAVSWTDHSSSNQRAHTCPLRWRHPDSDLLLHEHQLPVIPLDIDGVTIEKMSTFIGSRQNPDALVRHGHMLAHAISVLRSEEASERPFIDLVASTASAEHGIGFELAMTLAISHTKRWRCQRVKHRPLASADTAAFAEIKSSIADELATRALPTDEALVTSLIEDEGVVWVGRKPNGEYVSVATPDGAWAHVRTIGKNGRMPGKLEMWRKPPATGKWVQYWSDSMAWGELNSVDRTKTLPGPSIDAVVSAVQAEFDQRRRRRIIAIRIRAYRNQAVVYSVTSDAESVYVDHVGYALNGGTARITSVSGSTNPRPFSWVSAEFSEQRNGTDPLAPGSQTFAYIDREWFSENWQQD